MSRHTSEVLKKLLDDVLRQAGLSEMEVRLYELSFELGPTKISTLASELGVSRPTIYSLIERLTTLGLADSRQDKRSLTFWVESPLRVLKMVEAKNDLSHELQHSLLTTMPKMLSAYHHVKNAPKTLVVEGREALVFLHDQILEEEHHEILFCGSPKDFIEMLPPRSFKNWLERRIKAGVRVKSLVPEGKNVERDNAKELREVRIWSDASPFPTTFQIFGKKLVLWQPLALYAVVMQDPTIVEMMRTTFHRLWKSGTPLQEVIEAGAPH